MIELVIIIVFLLYLSYREWMINVRIKDLELKLFSKDSQEYATYKNIDNPQKEKPQKEDDDLVDLENVNPADAIKGIIK